MEEASAQPIQEVLTLGCDPIHRPYMEMAMNGPVEPSRGVTRAAAIVPIPLTAISSCPGQPIGLTCLNHSTSTQSERRTTMGQRSYSAPQRPRH